MTNALFFRNLRPKSRFRKRNPFPIPSLRAPERCVPARRSPCLRRNASCRQAFRHAGVAISLQRGEIHFTRNDNFYIGIWVPESSWQAIGHLIKTTLLFYYHNKNILPREKTPESITPFHKRLAVLWEVQEDQPGGRSHSGRGLNVCLNFLGIWR